MKRLLVALGLLLFFRHAAAAQGDANPVGRVSSQRWGWFHNADWAKKRILTAPGWTLKQDYVDADSIQHLLFATPDSEKGISFLLANGSIFSVSYMFFLNDKTDREWLTRQFERVGPNEWTDAKNNARILRRVEDDLLIYEVAYARLTKD